MCVYPWSSSVIHIPSIDISWPGKNASQQASTTDYRLQTTARVRAAAAGAIYYTTILLILLLLVIYHWRTATHTWYWKNNAPGPGNSTIQGYLVSTKSRELLDERERKRLFIVYRSSFIAWLDNEFQELIITIPIFLLVFIF